MARRSNEKEPRSDSLAATRSEVPKCGKLVPACMYISTAQGGRRLEEERRTAGYRDRERAEAYRASHHVWYRAMCEEAVESYRQGRSFSVDFFAERTRRFTLRNDVTPALSRLLIEEHPELAAIIKLKPARCDLAFGLQGNETEREHG